MKQIDVLYAWKSDAEERLAATTRDTYWRNGTDITEEVRTMNLSFITIVDGLIAAETGTDCQT